MKTSIKEKTAKPGDNSLVLSIGDVRALIHSENREFIIAKEGTSGYRQRLTAIRDKLLAILAESEGQADTRKE